MPLIRSWVKSANSPNTNFPLNNLPYGVYTVNNQDPHCCVAIGDMVLDVTLLEKNKIISPSSRTCVFQDPSWNKFMELGSSSWSKFRAELTALLKEHPVESKVDKEKVTIASFLANRFGARIFVRGFLFETSSEFGSDRPQKSRKMEGIGGRQGGSGIC